MGSIGEWRIMLRINIFVSVIPLLVAGLFGRAEPVAVSHPCIALGGASMQIAPAPWQAQTHVSFTDNSALATIRVQVVDHAADADFAVVDDTGDVAADACPINASTRYVGIAPKASAMEPVIYLSHDSNADLRVFVQSRTFSERDAAALLVAAQSDRSRLAAAAL